MSAPKPQHEDVIRELVAEAVAAIPTPKDGRPGKDGRDGKDGADGLPGPRGDKGDKGDKGEPGKDGISVKGDAGSPGKDGRDGQDGAAIASLSVSGESLYIGLSDGKRLVASLEPVIEHILSRIPKIEPPKVQATESRVARGGGISSQKARAISREITFTSVTSDYTALPGDDVIECDTSNGAITITVPAGRKTWLQVKRSGSNSVTVVTDDGSLIEGETSRILNVDLYTIRMAWNGSQYREF